jgi:hypoxanthine phosphoribosyltransferase
MRLFSLCFGMGAGYAAKRARARGAFRRADRPEARLAPPGPAGKDTSPRPRPKETSMSAKPYVIDQLISAKSIAARVEALAHEIEAHYRGTDKLIVIGLLRGSFVFIADLARELDLPVEIDFIEASSYGNSTMSSREVRILKDLRGEIEGRDVLVVEDIVDTGFTLHHVLHLLHARKPRRLEVCALLDKPSRREVDVKARFIGFQIPDEFVVGYGIDYAQMNRNLSYIGKVRFTD